MNLQPIRALAAAVLAVAATTYPAAQAVPAPQKSAPATDPYRDEPLVFERLDTDTRMKADGTGEIISHLVVRVQSEGTARSLSVLSLSFASATQTAAYDFVRVHKKDGTTVETPVADTMEMSSDVSRQAPVYSDLKEKHLPVRALSVGDTLDYQARVVLTKAEAPGQFWGGTHFVAAGAVVLQQAVSLSVPVDTYVQVYSPKHPATPVTRDGLKVWTWTSSQLKPSQRDENGKMTPADIKDPDTDAEGRSLPSVAWTTFRSWDDVGKWYRGLIDPRAQPTPEVRAKAEELTKEAKSPEAQVQALYRFVATGIRYVGIGFGVGRIQPHAAADVLANGYGDCKDKDTLFEALLRAKGFTTAPALIGAGIAPVVDLPSPTNFNHEITTVDLPGTGRIWLDTTAEVAPFRLLSPSIRDQEALVLPANGPATLMKTPADPPFPYSETFESVGTLSDKGVLKTHISMIVRSDSELAVRSMMQRLSPSQWDEAMGYIAAGLNFGGKVTNADLRQDDPAGPVHLGFDYTREDFADWKNNRIFANFPTLEVVTLDKDKAPDYNINLGAPRTLVARSTLTVPAGDRMELPSAVHAERPYMTFDKKYRFADGKFLAERTLVIKQQKLNKDQWKDYLAFSKEAGFEDGEKYAVLIPAAGKAAPASNFSADTATHQELEVQILSLEKAQDWAGARRLATRLKERFSSEPYVDSMLAYVDLHDHKYDEAVAGLKAELAAHPDDDSNIVSLLAGAYVTQKKYADAIDLLKQYSSRNDLRLLGLLMSAQQASGDMEGALATIRGAIANKPDDKNLQTSAVSLLKQMHRNAEAVEAAHVALDGADDPNVINNNAYFLAEMKADLPFAEEQSQKSIDLFAKATGSGTVQEANTEAFNLSAEMVAAWDTLGYIFLIEKKAADAEPYLHAAWFQSPDIVKGDHLALAYEAQGKKAEALRIFRLALQTEFAKNAKEEFAEATAHAEKLEKAGVKAPDDSAQLLAMRTFHIPKAAGAQGGGTVRLQIDRHGVADAILVTGAEPLKAELESVKKLAMPGAVPAASQARVLRDAVVYCGKTTAECDFVLMTRSGIGAESASE